MFLIWRFRVARCFIRQVTDMPFREAWEYAGRMADSFDEGFSPAEAVNSEISYWEP